MNRLTLFVPATYGLALKRQSVLLRSTWYFNAILLLIGLFLLTACQPISAPAGVAPTPPSATPQPPPTAADFAYLVRITDGDDQPIARAHVLIEVQGAAYFDAYADNNGYIREFFNPTQDERPARLIVEAAGFRSHRQEIDLRAA